MKSPIIVSATGWSFKKELTQIEYYGMYAYIVEAFNRAYEYHDNFLEPLSADFIESMFGYAPSGGNISCTKYVEWPGFEFLGPVDYFVLTENHILLAVFVNDDEETQYLRLN